MRIYVCLCKYILLCFQYFRCSRPTPALPGVFANTASRSNNEVNNSKFVIDRSGVKPKISIQLTKAIAAGTEILVPYGKAYAGVLKRKIAAAANTHKSAEDVQIEAVHSASTTNTRERRKCALCESAYWPAQQLGHATRCPSLEVGLRGSRMTGVSFKMCFP